MPYAIHLWQVNDASGLNGAFKIELTTVKCIYVQHWNVPKFEPTDVVPLTNMAFLRSFGNSLNAKCATANWGWNPLNYYLLTVLPDVLDVTEAKDKENFPPPTPKHNLWGVTT